MGKKKKRILLGHLNNNGDCFLATTIARQIKYDYPDCILTWAIGTCCKHIIDNNPFVDHVWEIPLSQITEENVLSAWNVFTTDVAKKGNHQFDLVFFMQYSYGRTDNYMGVTRASIFAGYPFKIKVPVLPILNLNNVEVANVKLFAESNQLNRFKKVILFECVANSGQSFITDNFTSDFCKIFKAQYPDSCLILSSGKKFEICDHNIIDGSTLSIRENAELTKYCTSFIGVSSGISWICTSDWAKDLPRILLIKKDCPQASMIMDHAYFKIKGKKIFETNQCTPFELLSLLNDDSIYGTVFKEEDFERLCYYATTEFYIQRRNIKRLAEIFLSAPSIKIKRKIFRQIKLKKLKYKFLAVLMKKMVLG